MGFSRNKSEGSVAAAEEDLAGDGMDRDALDDDLYQHAAPLDELRWQLEWEE